MLLVFLAVSALSLLAYQAEGHHYLELLSHFRPQYLLIQVVCLVGMLLMRSWHLATMAFFGLFLNLVPIVPYYNPYRDVDTATRDHVKIVQLNLLATNQNYEKVIKFIGKTDPDIIGFEEVRPHWASTLTKELQNYPYRVIEPENTAFGIALFSKRPLTNSHVVRFGKAYQGNRFFPSIVADTLIGGNPTTIIVTHPLPPMAGFDVRNSQLADIANKRAKFHDNLIVIGDLNVTPWSSYFQNFLKKTGLRDSQMGFGVQPSWKSPLPFVSIPIDHILTSDQFIVFNRVLGRPIGSDHLPVIVDLEIQ